MLRMHEREYPADSWMVRRWDEWCERHYMGTHKLIEEYVSDGRGGRYPIDRVRFFPRDPHSFCEFWRTVTLYYTLEQLGMKLANRLFSEEYVE